jgi:hypothetical protein
MTEPQVRALFNQIADGETAPSRVDTQLALRRGRARLRWRRACVVSAPVLAAAAVAVVALAVAAGPGRPGTSPAAPGPAAPRQFNPLMPYVAFGWLPAGQSLSQGVASREEVAMVTADASSSPGWGLSLNARGQCHLTNSGRGLKCVGETPLEGATARFSEPAPAVGGHSAFWAGTNLVWPFARGGWAWLNIPVPDFSALRHDTVTQGQAIKIARHLRFGVATPPLVFPAQLSGLTGQWRISDLHYEAAAGVLQADSYTLTTGTSRFFPHVGDLGIWTNAPYVDIHPSPRTGTCTPHDPSTQNTSEIINGYRVVLKRTSAGGHPEQEVCAAHADGLWLDIIEFGPRPLIDVSSLFRQHLQLLGTNPANWTKNPIR